MEKYKFYQQNAFLSLFKNFNYKSFKEISMIFLLFQFYPTLLDLTWLDLVGTGWSGQVKPDQSRSIKGMSS